MMASNAQSTESNHHLGPPLLLEDEASMFYLPTLRVCPYHDLYTHQLHDHIVDEATAASDLPHISNTLNGSSAYHFAFLIHLGTSYLPSAFLH
jgi:hypothetical protein